MKKNHKKNDTLSEPTAIYKTEKIQSDSNGTLLKTEQEFKQYFQNIEKEKFTDLNEADKQFEEWKQKHLSNLL